jgi:hypothetical protein
VRVAVHPKFGRGIIVAEQDGKYEIDFDSGERKRLLARFVTVEAREKAT